MGQKISAAVLGASLILPGIASALGLGDITLHSALNQPLKADIELKKIGELGSSEILTKLASAKEFEASGVDRPFFLNDVQFQVQLSADGQAIIRLSSRKPVVEPFLNFIVEVQWPQGKLLKEYTLLLDPPVFSQEAIQPVSPPAAQLAGSQALVERPAREASAVSGGAFSTSEAAGGAAYSGDSYGPVKRSDSLWEIAKKVRPSETLTIHQTMVAIQEKNPDAFLRNNINLLKEGQVLRIPGLDEIQRNTHPEAVAIVKQQNDNWKQNRTNTAKKVEASESQLGANVEQAPVDPVEGDGRLTLVASSEDGAENKGALGASEGEIQSETVVALQQELTMKGEELDKSIIQNQNLQNELDEINQQLKTSEDLVQLKDDQIAALQKQLSLLDDQIKERDASQSPAHENLTRDLIENPYVLAGLGAVLVALVAALLGRRKTQPDEGDDLPIQTFEMAASGSDSEASLNPNDVAESAHEEDVSNISEADASEDAAPSESENEIKQELGDVIGEADIYIAYGRFNHAAELLKQGSEAEPERTDIRLKLLEVLVETGDKDEFTKHDLVLRETAEAVEMQAADALYVKMFGHERIDQDSGESISVDSIGQSEESSLTQDEQADGTGYESSADELDYLDSALETEITTGDAFEEESNVIDFSAGTEESEGGIEESALEVDEQSIAFHEEEPSNMDLSEADTEHGLMEAEDVLQESDNLSDSADEEGLTEVDLELDLEDLVTQQAAPGEGGTEGEAANQGFDLDLDDVSELELNGEVETKENTLNEMQEDLGFDLEEMGDAEVGLDLDSLEESLEDAGVDLSDAVEATDEDGDRDSGSDEIASEIKQEELSGDINLDEEDLDMLSDLDENATKLDLARAYLEMGDAMGAKEILQEVLEEGNDTQKHDAEELLAQIA